MDESGRLCHPVTAIFTTVVNADGELFTYDADMSMINTVVSTPL